MKNSIAIVFAFFIMFPSLCSAELFSNPGTNVGKKNLVVGVEYSRIIHGYDIDTTDLPTASERIKLKVTAGLSDWFDIYIEGGGAGLMLDYKENDANTLKNFDSDFKAGLGLGARIRLLDFPNSRTRVFLQGGGFYFKTDDTIEWDYYDKKLIKNRDMKWADYYIGLGIVKRIDFVDLSFGLGFSGIQWWFRDTEEEHVGNAIQWDKKPWRDSSELTKPVFGFIGIDFILPYEYRVSVQTGITGIDDYGFSVALSQGLEKD